MKFINIILAATICSTLASCATVGNPEGGTKDTTPPTLQSSNPANQQLNVSTQTISLTFDEEVQPNSMTRELLITPNVDNPYRVNTKKNVLELVFENPLEQNTTYTLNFRKGIQDITEKNSAEGLQLTFSTGSFIDSSTVSGTVRDLLTQQPEKEAIVALYPTTDSLNIRKNRPYYQAQIDAAGNFKFQNVREGEYRIFALVDKNNNSIYDSENEKIAYRNQPIRVSPETQEILLQTLRIDTKRPILMRQEKFLDRFVANYGEGLRTFHARPLQGSPDTIIYKPSIDGKAMELYGGKGFTGGRTILTAADSAGNIKVDTIQVAFEGKRAQRVKGAQIKTQPANGGTFRVGQPLTIELETPVTITSKEPVLIMADSVVIRALKYPGEVTMDATQTELTFNIPTITLGRNRQYSIALDSVGISPVQGQRINFASIPLALAETKGTGTVRGTVATQQASFFIQLLDKDFKLVNQLRNQKTFQFRNVEPGTYHIRVLVDENNDGKWYAGDPNLRQEPERVFLHPEPLEVRANWEMEGIKLEF